MSHDILLASEVLLLGLYLFLAATHYFTRRAREVAITHAKLPGIRRRIRHWIVGGTDADLRLEVAYFTALTILALTASRVGPAERVAFDSVHAVIGSVLGFHLRQWFSKWRLRNIVFSQILFKQRLLYFKGGADTLACIANIALTVVLVRSNEAYVFFAFVGFFIQDLTLEAGKASRILKRKLHIFDLDGLPVPAEKRQQLFDAVRKHSARSLRSLVRKSKSPRDRVLLHGFTLLLHDDFDGFRELIDREAALIESDADLLFYFGKALYASGDVLRARSFLDRGCSMRNRDRLCMAYYALTLIADTNDDGLPTALSILDEYYQHPGTAKGDMFGLAFYALALGLTDIERGSWNDARRARFEKAFWCINEALRLNEGFADRDNLGSLQQHYFLGNEQMLLDIYGYLLYCMDSHLLAFRVLEDSIRQDDTYPWPYFHLALIYERIGRGDLAHALYARIALHERSDTVLRRLCASRMAANPLSNAAN